MQQQRHSQCKACGKFSLHVRGSSYTMPHVGHLLAVIALSLLIHPVAGAAWCGVWALHAACNLGIGGGLWVCTACGK